jgi:two-component system OmpR family response regulator
LGRPLHVLVVEDEEMISDILKTLLSGDGLEVSLARDASRARAIARSRRPDLLVCDLHLPDEFGINLCREMADEFPDCKIILMTGSNDFSDTVDLSTRKGLTGPVLQKPFSLSKFRGIVRSLCEHAGEENDNSRIRREQLVL